MIARRGLHSRDVICQTRTPAAPGAAATAIVDVVQIAFEPGAGAAKESGSERAVCSLPASLAGQPETEPDGLHGLLRSGEMSLGRRGVIEP